MSRSQQTLFLIAALLVIVSSSDYARKDQWPLVHSTNQKKLELSGSSLEEISLVSEDESSIEGGLSDVGKDGSRPLSRSSLTSTSSRRKRAQSDTALIEMNPYERLRIHQSNTALSSASLDADVSVRKRKEEPDDHHNPAVGTEPQERSFLARILAPFKCLYGCASRRGYVSSE